MLPPSSKYLQRSADPVAAAERESRTRRLNQACADGRISHDQYAADMDIVYAARVLGDLVPVIERLPAAIMVGVVGVALLAMLLLLLVVLF